MNHQNLLEQKNPRQGEHREFGNVAKVKKTQGILYAQDVNSLILKIKDIAIFAAKYSNLLLETQCGCQVSFT